MVGLRPGDPVHPRGAGGLGTALICMVGLRLIGHEILANAFLSVLLGAALICLRGWAVEVPPLRGWGLFSTPFLGLTRPGYRLSPLRGCCLGRCAPGRDHAFDAVPRTEGEQAPPLQQKPGFPALPQTSREAATELSLGT